MTQSELVERIMWAVDGYRFGYFDLAEMSARVIAMIEEKNMGTPVVPG